jgi:hypothetical protein
MATDAPSSERAIAAAAVKRFISVSSERMECSLVGANVGSNSCKMPERALQLRFMVGLRSSKIREFHLRGLLTWLTTATTKTQSTLLV